MIEWIKTSEQLPEISKHVFFKTVLATIKTDRFTYVSQVTYQHDIVRGKQQDRWHDIMGRLIQGEVTHWMPLPEPAKEYR